MLQVQGIWTLAANCPTPVKISLINGKPEVVSKSESEEFISQGEEEESDMDDDTTCDSIGLNCIQSTTSIHLSVVRCALSQSKKKDEYRRITMFHIIMKIGRRSCKITVNCETYINDVSFSVIAKFGLKVVPHPHLYRVT